MGVIRVSQSGHLNARLERHVVHDVETVFEIYVVSSAHALNTRCERQLLITRHGQLRCANSWDSSSVHVVFQWVAELKHWLLVRRETVVWGDCVSKN